LVLQAGFFFCIVTLAGVLIKGQLGTQEFRWN